MNRILIPLLFISCNSYASGIQKWVDEGGNVNYGDTPPSKVQTESISVSRPPSNPGKPLPRFTGSEGKKESAEDIAKKKQQDRVTSDANAEVCERAKKDLDIISRSDLIRLKQNDGSERVLSTEEVDQRRSQLENDIQQYCN